MSNVSMAGSHQVSISHDPIEEHTSAGRDQLRSGRDAWPSGGARPSRYSSSQSWGQMSDMLPSVNVSDLRPALLAGAIGLFAAWIVSDMSSGSRRHQSSGRRGGGYVGGREDWSRRQDYGQPTRQPQRYSAGPEGQSSPADLSLDAMNP